MSTEKYPVNTTSSLGNTSPSRCNNSDGASDATHLTEREQRVLGAINADPGARESFAFLVRKIGCGRETLITQLTIEAWGPLSIDGASSGRDIWRDLPSFAKKLKRIAREIAFLNKLEDWRFADLPAVTNVTNRERVQRAFGELPMMLERYAENIRFKLGKAEKSYKLWPPPLRKEIQFSFSEGLQKWIQKNTGRFYRDKLATIQRITYQLAGRKGLPSDGETLRKRDYREKRRLGHPKPRKKPGH